MSHIVVVHVHVHDRAAVDAACQRLGLPQPVEGTFKLFSAEAKGLAIQLPGWTYPVVADLATGHLQFDNFQGRWGTLTCLDQFLQAYAVERARAEARKRGHLCTESAMADGSIRLTIHVHGGTDR